MYKLNITMEVCVTSTLFTNIIKSSDRFMLSFKLGKKIKVHAIIEHYIVLVDKEKQKEKEKKKVKQKKNPTDGRSFNREERRKKSASKKCFF